MPSKINRKRNYCADFDVLKTAHQLFVSFTFSLLSFLIGCCTILGMIVQNVTTWVQNCNTNFELKFAFPVSTSSVPLKVLKYPWRIGMSN